MHEDKVEKGLEALLSETAKIIAELTPRERRHVDTIEVVFIDVVNDQLKHDRVYAFADVIYALGRGAQPAGLLLLHDEDPDKIEIRELPNITSEQRARLMHAFAEAQDEDRENLGLSEEDEG